VTLARPSRAAGVPVVVPPFLVVAAILLLALNLRGPIVAVAPVLDAISADLGISATTAGLLTGLPVLCFGLATPAASALLARAGLGRGVSISLVVLLAGMLLRSVGGLPTALAGTLLIGIATWRCRW
jgi:MFS transporter, CP family, cyanate transporter